MLEKKLWQQKKIINNRHKGSCSQQRNIQLMRMHMFVHQTTPTGWQDMTRGQLHQKYLLMEDCPWAVNRLTGRGAGPSQATNQSKQERVEGLVKRGGAWWPVDCWRPRVQNCTNSTTVKQENRWKRSQVTWCSPRSPDRNLQSCWVRIELPQFWGGLINGSWSCVYAPDAITHRLYSDHLCVDSQL